MKAAELTPWKRFFRLLAIEKKDIIQIFYYAIFSGVLSLTLPLGIQAIINLVQGAEVSSSWIVLVLLVTAGVVVTGVLQLMQLRIIETLQQKVLVRASFELCYRFPKIKMELLRNTYPPELANRFFDSLTIQKSLSKILIDVPAALLQVLFALILLSFYHSLFIVFGIVLLLIIYFVFRYTARKGLVTSLEESKYKYKIAHWIQEVARSVISFKLSGKTNLALEKNDVLVGHYIQAREKHFSIIRIQFIKMIGFKAIITAGLLIIGGILVLTQQINIGQFVAAEIIILLVINSIEKLILGLETLYDMLTSIEKLGRVVDLDLEPSDGESISLKDELNIELENVSLRVEGRERSILQGVHMRLNSKTRMLLDGKSGSGKSTLLKILSGVIEPTSGEIYVNGLKLGALKLNDFRAKLGLSLSEEFPFEGTLRENLTFECGIHNDDEINEVIELLYLRPFIKSLPKGLSSVVYPEGKQMSKTIVKKIILARAILKKPKFMILENALEHFDETEKNSIIEFLSHKDRPWGLVVVSDELNWKDQCAEQFQLEAN